MLGFFYMIPTNSFIFISFIDICDYSQNTFVGSQILQSST